MTDAALLNLSIDRGSDESLFAQVFQQIKAAILAGSAAPGSRLPSSRALAEDLAVSRTTIVTAYEQLVAEGFALSRQGARLVVCDLGAVEKAPSAKRKATPRAVDANGQERPRPFQPGYPDLRLFPYTAWARCVAKAARAAPRALIIADRFGDPALRAAIAAHLSDWRGIAAEPQQIIVTAGSADALEIALRTLTESGQPVALEDPGYLALRRVVEGLGRLPVWLRAAAGGPDPITSKCALRAAKLLLVTPSNQFPLGGAMPMAHRLAFLEQAEASGAWIIEDDFDGEFRYGGRPIPALAALDRFGRTLYLGSFSKTLSPSLRLSYLVVPRDLIGRFATTVATMGTKASLPPQRPLATFIEEGAFHRHIRKMRRTYGARRQALLRQLREDLGEGARIDDFPAGMHLILHLPAETDDLRLSRAALGQGVVLPPLSSYFAGAARSRGLVFGFSTVAEMDMAAPLSAVAELLSQAVGRVR